ncbi:uncharacterized mitochondrial protein AtMg00810-like [Lactuca sativa]|uniref:uncharacterized mitochondrial protein AtMg00810-like n=1 Tax=Lactuca sativa TaxID=4236 RepID=UPI000CD98887|nr:uncharacterized mitochondrial protein AtMg00810-like [Lactuca sativa]
MAKKFEMSMMCELTFFLGLNVKKIIGGVFVCQAKYIADMLKKYGFYDCKPTKTLMSSSTSIGVDPNGADVNTTLFRGMIGSMLYHTVSRPDIMFATILCAHYQADPKKAHLFAVKRIFRYLKYTPNLRLWYPHDSEFKLMGYTDSDHGGCGIDRKITSGGAQMLGDIFVSWSSKNQTSVDCSTAEAGYVAVGREDIMENGSTFMSIQFKRFDGSSLYHASEKDAKMSTPNDAFGSSSNNNNNKFLLLNICLRVTLDGTNYNDWMRNIKMALRFEDKEYVLEKELLEIDETKSTFEERAEYKKHYNDATKVACTMVVIMTPELQWFYEDY